MVDLPQIIASVVIGALASLAVGYATARWYGPRWALKEARRHEHSAKLVNEVLAPWLHDPSRYCRLGVAFGGLGWGDFTVVEREGGGVILGRVTGSEIRECIDPPLEYFNALRSHLQTGYRDVVEMWEDIKGQRSQHSKDVQSFLNSLEREVFERSLQKGEQFHYWNGEREPPPSYLLTRDTKFLMWKELTDRATHKGKFRDGKPTVVDRPVPGGIVYELSWKPGHPALIRTETRETCQEFLTKILYVCDSPTNIERVAGLWVNSKNKLEAVLKTFQGSLQEIKSKVDLGGNLKGKCPYCP
jgi:hypothetical protein